MRSRSHAVVAHRAGVSLVEMLVVLAIILTLATIAWTTLSTTGQSARTASTRATLVKLDSILKQRVNDLRQNFTDQEKKGTLNTADWMNLSSGTSHSLFGAAVPMASRIAIVKADRYRGVLPQRVEDLYGLDQAAGGGDDSPLLAIWNSSAPYWNNTPIDASAHDRKTESSELLYLAITRGVRSGASADVLGDINIRHIQDTDGDGRPEFVDDWGKPLRFYNAPTRLARPGGEGAAVTPAQYALAASLMSGLPATPAGAATDPGYFRQSFNQDPFDPRRALGNAAVSSIRSTFETYYRTLDTWYQPIIVSCGPDEDLGMGEPTAADATRLGQPVVDGDGNSAATDNVTSGQSGS